MQTKTGSSAAGRADSQNTAFVISNVKICQRPLNPRLIAQKKGKEDQMESAISNETPVLTRADRLLLKTSPQSHESHRHSKSKQDARQYMSVKQMGDLLGLGRTERYWLVHQNRFETETIRGKMWVNVSSFENWYANQVKYRKINGEEPGQKLREWSYSIRDIAGMLNVSESRVYKLAKNGTFETIHIDDRIRIPRASFDTWYSSQDHFRNEEDRRKDVEAVRDTITLPQMAALLGISRKQVYGILKSPKYAKYFSIVTYAGHRRVTKESFSAFLDAQDRYALALETTDEAAIDGYSSDDCASNTGETTDRPFDASSAISSDKGSLPSELRESTSSNSPDPCKEDSSSLPEYLPIAKAASMAGISRQALSKYGDNNSFEMIKRAGRIYIRQSTFASWLDGRNSDKAQINES